jgi:hypothetical protein
MAGASAAAVVLVGERLQRQQRVEQVDIPAARLVVKRFASLVVNGLDDVVIDLAFQGQAQPVEPVEGLSGEVGDFVREALGAQASERVLERETKVDGHVEAPRDTDCDNRRPSCGGAAARTGWSTVKLPAGTGKPEGFPPGPPKLGAQAKSRRLCG